MDNLSVYILDGIIALCIGCFVKYVAPYLKTVALPNLVKYLVLSAEKNIQGSGMGEDKKKLVISLIEKMGIKTTEVVDNLIDGAVVEMQANQGKMTSTVVNNIVKK